MVNRVKLSMLCRVCYEANYMELYKEFNELRSQSLGRDYCDFTYECNQIIESCSTGKYPKKFIDKLTGIING